MLTVVAQLALPDHKNGSMWGLVATTPFRGCVATRPDVATVATRPDVVVPGDLVGDATHTTNGNCIKIIFLVFFPGEKKWNGMEWNGMEWNGMEWAGPYFGGLPK